MELKLEDVVSDDLAHGTIQALGLIALKYGFGVARLIINKWITKLAETDGGSEDNELKQAAYEYIEELERIAKEEGSGEVAEG